MESRWAWPRKLSAFKSIASPSISPALPRLPRRRQSHRRGPLVGPVRAAARISSISETCRRLDKASCEETFTAALYPQLHDLNALKRRINAAFASHLPRTLRRRRKRPLALAIDLTLIAYYGRHSLDDAHIYRSQAKRGINSFFAYATA